MCVGIMLSLKEQRAHLFSKMFSKIEKKTPVECFLRFMWRIECFAYAGDIQNVVKGVMAWMRMNVLDYLQLQEWEKMFKKKVRSFKKTADGTAFEAEILNIGKDLDNFG